MRTEIKIVTIGFYSSLTELMYPSKEARTQAEEQEMLKRTAEALNNLIK